jgi:two-component system sensor kinase FixL
MKLRIDKASNNLPISLKILCGFLSVCCALTAASGIVYYHHSKKVVEDSIREQASDLCERIEREFAMYYAAPIEHELHILVTSPQLNNYLMSSKEEMPLRRAEVEQLFLSLSHGRDLYRSTTFLDASAQERIATCGNTRIRTFRSLTQMADEGLLSRNMSKVFAELKSGPANTLAHSDPFYDAQNRLGILVATAMQEPEAGGFGGAVVQHCDLMGFLREVSQSRILGAAVVWVYGSEGETLASPPEGEIRQDPMPYLTGAKASADGYVYTAECRFLPGDQPALTVACSIPPEILSRELLPVIRSVVVIFSILLAGSLASSFLISRWISGRIRRLTKAARNVSARRLDIDLDAGLTESTDEIGVLANAFREMILDLKESTTSIETLNLEITQREQAQVALQNSEERFRQRTALLKNVLSHIPYFIFWKDRNSVYLGCNEMFAKSAGVEDPDHIVDKTDYDLVWKNEADLYRQCDRQVMDTGEPLLNFEEPQTREDGRQITLLTSKVPLRDASGRVTGILGIYADITARKCLEDALRESEVRFRSVVEQAGDGFELLDVQGRFVDTNSATCRALGYTKKELLSLTIPDVNPLVDRDEYAAIIQSLQGQPPKTFESVHRRKDGTTFPVEITLSLIQLGGVPRCLALARDITGRRKAEEQQAQLLQKLSGINQELRDFAYVVSHDLKAPLRAIRNLADWLCADYQDKLDPQGKENLQLLSSRVDRMQNLIDGVLQYSRVGRTEQGTKPVDLGQIVPEIIENLSAPEHISIHVESDLPTVEADPTRITQVFQNLLSNAIKYVDKPQGNITVGCVEEDGFWKFSVCDNGPGIEEKYFERIFKLFQTLAPRDGNESTGVGLTITKKIIEMYGGKIWVESEVGKGSTFFFTFPQQNERTMAPTCPTCAVGQP